MKRHRSINIVVFLVCLIGLIACRDASVKQKGSGDEPVRQMELRYATGFSVDYFPGYKRLILFSPWEQGAELARYYLVTNKDQSTPSDGLRVLIPVHSLVTASSTHYAFLDLLGELDKVIGLCEAKRVYNPTLRKGCETGRITDLGDPFRMNVERCLMLKPELVMVSGYNQYDEHANRLQSAGVPVVYNNEWMEPDLLGRAEWIRYIACFFDKEELADSLFIKTAERYEKLKMLGMAVKGEKPLVLSGDNFRGTWYQPGGRSFTARLFQDAGGRYVYSKDTTRGSLPLSFEQVYKDLGNADVWVGATGGATLGELQALDQRYALFKAFREGNVYAYTNRVTPQGGNDFWEGAVANPDSLLADFLFLFHPDCLPNHTWTYLKKLSR